MTRKKADSIVHTNLAVYVNGNDYLLFSVADRWYLIIVKNQQVYHEYYLNIKDKSLGTNYKKIVTNNRLLSKAFDSTEYHKGYRTFNSTFYRGKKVLSEGNITYFYLMKNGTKYGEARLSIKISPNPINEKLYDYLSSELFLFMSKHAPNKL